MEEAGDVVIGKHICVFRVGREAMVGAREWDFKELDGGAWREGGSELGDVEWGVDEGDGITLLPLYVEGQG